MPSAHRSHLPSLGSVFFAPVDFDVCDLPSMPSNTVSRRRSEKPNTSAIARVIVWHGASAQSTLKMEPKTLSLTARPESRIPDQAPRAPAVPQKTTP